MGSRDHACETCGLGGMNDARPCICGDSRCPTCDRVGADCPTLEVLVRSTVAQGEARRIALAAMKDCQAHRVEWRSRALAAEAELTATRETVERIRNAHRDAMDRMRPVIIAADAWADEVREYIQFDGGGGGDRQGLCAADRHRHLPLYQQVQGVDAIEVAILAHQLAPYVKEIDAFAIVRSILGHLGIATPATAEREG
jgi:hypothetical protein